MKVRALRSFSNGKYSPSPGQILTIEDLTMAQDLINAGYVVEVETCLTCGSTVDKVL